MNKIGVCLLVPVLSCAIGVVPGFADNHGGDKGESAQISSQSGEQRVESDFLSYCAVCHGFEGQGDGPLAEMLIVRPADLTRISERNGGEFPKDRVEVTIRDGGGLKSHGDSSMLAWRNFFEEDVHDNSASDRIEDLTKYIEKLQVE